MGKKQSRMVEIDKEKKIKIDIDKCECTRNRFNEKGNCVSVIDVNKIDDFQHIIKKENIVNVDLTELKKSFIVVFDIDGKYYAYLNIYIYDIETKTYPVYYYSDNMYNLPGFNV
jgi:hypothetical protein